MGKEERRQTGSKEEKKHLSSLHKQEVPPSCSGLVKPLWLPQPQPLPYAAIWAHCFDNLHKKACIQKKQAKSCACASHNFSCVLHHVHLFLPPLHGMIPLQYQALGTGDSHVKWPPRRTEQGHNNQCYDLQHGVLAGLWVRSSASSTAKDNFWPHRSIMISHQRRYEDLALQVQKAKGDALTQNCSLSSEPT